MKRLWIATHLMICIAAQILIGGQSARSEEKPTGARLLPKDTLMVVSIPNAVKFDDEFDKSLTGAMFRDAALKPFLDDVRKVLDEKTRDQLDITLTELLAFPRGEVTFAVLERTRKFAPLLMIDYGDNKEIVEKLLKKLSDLLDDKMDSSTQEVEEVTAHVFTVKGQDPATAASGYNKLVYFDDDSYLVISLDVAALKEVIIRRKGDTENTLANSEVYKYVQERCKEESSDPCMVWFLSPIGIIRSGLSVAQKSLGGGAAMAAIFLPTLGVDKLKGLGGASYYNAGDFDTISKMFLYADQPSKGIPAAFQFPATDLAPPKWVTADTSMYFSGNWDVENAFQAVEKLLDGFYGAGFTGKQLDQAAAKDPGLHLKQDLISLLDGKFHVIQGFETNEEGAPTQTVLVALDVKDKDVPKMKKTLSQLGKSAPQVETREFNGEVIYEISTGFQTVSFALAAGQVIVTNDTDSMERLLRADSRPSLVESSAYRKISKHFPAKVSTLSYSQSEAQMKWLYSLLKNYEDQEVVEGIDLKKLPPFEVLQKYLRSAGSYSIPDKKGVTFVGFQLREGDE